MRKKIVAKQLFFIVNMGLWIFILVHEDTFFEKLLKIHPCFEPDLMAKWLLFSGRYAIIHIFHRMIDWFINACLKDFYPSARICS